MLPKIEPHNHIGELLYLAFRASYVTSHYQLMCEFEESQTSHHDSHGFLDHIKLAVGCAPQIQLDLLLKTWNKLSRQGFRNLTTIDQCVCFCATCELAFYGETENRHRIVRATNGPRELADTDIIWLASKLRTVQITWPFPVDSALLLRDADMLNGDLDETHGGTSVNHEASMILDLVGAWQVSPNILSNADGLLTPEEKFQLGAFFQKHPRLMNL